MKCRGGNSKSPTYKHGGSVSFVPRIPILDELATEPIPSGSTMLVEFDAASQWYNASVGIMVGWVEQGGSVEYVTAAQQPDGIRKRLNRFGLDVSKLENEDRVWIGDLYTPTLRQKLNDPEAGSLKAADLSILIAKNLSKPPVLDLLLFFDNMSTLARFNDDRAWVELCLTRVIPLASSRNVTIINGITRGVHEDWIYKTLESAHDCIIDFKLDETGEQTRNMIRARSMRNVGFDSRWHDLRIGPNFEVSIQS